MDIFGTKLETDGNSVGEKAFDSVGQASEWLEKHGWSQRHNGGYWKGPNGFATMFTYRVPTELKTVVSIESI